MEENKPFYDKKSLKNFKSKKILDLAAAKTKIFRIKGRGKTAGLCHGGFDLLHPGHIRHFESAKKLCDCLFVSVTSDRFVSKLKGNGRPIFTDKLRAYAVAGIEFVDYVVISDFKTGVEVIRLLRPSYYIKGPDYIDKNDMALKEEISAINSVGGAIKYTNDPKFSTTKIIKYIKEHFD
ncbi:adenylyltransferase/cytidyltransferase family protein [Candidatus Woesearchaeota archaeon]|nr:adenylyltransferase/cytidyltransferase family protein [Candidatus Woesearchaeota archaeon]